MARYTVNLIDRPGHCVMLSEHEGDDGREEAESWAKRESERQPLPVEVWRESKHGPTVLRRYVNGALT